MGPAELERIEMDLLLEALWQRHGQDFRSYARASLERRVRGFLSTCPCASVADLIPLVLHDEDTFTRLRQALSVPVTEMFRDPSVYQALREKVVPVLRTWPHFKVWHAGCATGEEVYSMAILVDEAGLHERATIYATDFNEEALATARAGTYGLDAMRDFTRAYQEAGGRGSFSDYYQARSDAAELLPRLREQVTFASHNLATDAAFGEMHVVLCRNVLIYFDRDLQDRVLALFAESLVHGGFLVLGPKEDLRFSSQAGGFEDVDREARIYRRVRRD